MERNFISKSECRRFVIQEGISLDDVDGDIMEFAEKILATKRKAEVESGKRTPENEQRR